MFGGVCVPSCVAVVVGLFCFVCFLCVQFLISTGSFIDFSNKFISKFLLQHQHGIGSDGACIITHSRQNETTAMRNKMCKFVFNANWKVFCFPLCVSSRLHLYVDLLAIFFYFVYSNQEFNSRACCKANYQLLKPTDVHTTKPNARIVNSYFKRLDFNTSMDRIYSKIETSEQTSCILVVGLVCFILFFALFFSLIFFLYSFAS